MKSKAERLSALRRESQRHAEEDAAQLDIRIHALAADFKDAGRCRTSRRWTARAARIQQAYHASKASLARRIQETKDRRIGRVQGDIMRKRQTRQQELDQATAAHRRFPEQLLPRTAASAGICASAVLIACAPSARGWTPGSTAGAGNSRPWKSPRPPEETRAALLERLEQARGCRRCRGDACRWRSFSGSCRCRF